MKAQQKSIDQNPNSKRAFVYCATTATLLTHMGSEVGVWRWRRRNPPAKQSITKKKKRAKKPSGFERSESGAALPARARSIALLSFCSFGRFSAAHGSRALPRSSWRGRAPRFNPFLLPCGDVTPLPLALSADGGGTGTTRRGRSRSGALLRAAAPPKRRQRLRLAGHGCARFVAFTPLKSQCSCSYVVPFLSSCALIAFSRRRGRRERRSKLGRIGGSGRSNKSFVLPLSKR